MQAVFWPGPVVPYRGEIPCVFTPKGHPSRLQIRSHGRSPEIGACLGKAEKVYPARELDQVVRLAH